jgi:hypothetical protein
MHSIVQSVCSSIVSIADNFTSNASLLTLLMLWSSLAHYVSHSLVLSQEIVSTPGAEFDRDVIKNKRLEETDIVINIRRKLFEMGEGG